MKKIIFSVLIISIIFLCACTKIQDDDQLTFMSWGSETEVKIVKTLIFGYEKENPNIKIKFLHVPQNYFQKLHLYLASAIEPDVMFVNNMYSQMYISANLFENLTPYFKDEIKDKYFDVALKAFARNDNLYVIPRDVSNLVLYVNRDIFEAKGIHLPEKFNSVKELTDILQQVVVKDKIWGINFDTTSLFWLDVISAQGGGLLSDDLQQIKINSPETVFAIQKYADLANRIHIAPTISERGSKTSAQMFINGELSMLLNGRWFTPVFRQMADFNWDIMEFPVDDNNKLLVDASGFAVSKRSKRKEQAIDFVRYMTSEKAISAFTKEGLIIPARKDVAYSEVFLDKTQKPVNSEAFLTTIEKSKPTPINDNYLFIDDIINQTLEPVFYGKMTSKDALNTRAIKELNKLL